MDTIALNLDRDMQLKQIELRLNIDFNTYSNITVSNSNELRLKTYNDSVNYKFDRDLILLDSDTLNLIIVDKSFYFKGQKVEEGNVDAIELSIKKTANVVDRLFVYKKNDALNKLNYGY